MTRDELVYKTSLDQTRCRWRKLFQIQAVDEKVSSFVLKCSVSSLYKRVLLRGDFSHKKTRTHTHTLSSLLVVAPRNKKKKTLRRTRRCSRTTSARAHKHTDIETISLK